MVTFAQVLQPPVTMPTSDTSTSQVAVTVQTRSVGSPAASSLPHVKHSSFFPPSPFYDIIKLGIKVGKNKSSGTR